MPEEFLAAIFGAGIGSLGCIFTEGKVFLVIAGGLIVVSALGFIL